MSPKWLRDGEVTWTTDANADNTADDPTLMQFAVGSKLVASATDGDIAPSSTQAVGTAQSPTWRWYSGNTLVKITNGMTDLTYTVALSDVGKHIRMVVTYRVGDNKTEETASLTSDYPVLAARDGDNKLKFNPDTLTTLTRSVAEGDKGMNVGAPVTATGNHGLVNYTIETNATVSNAPRHVRDRPEDRPDNDVSGLEP